MPAPNLYTSAACDPYTNVPVALRTTDATVLYATDRGAESEGPVLRYGCSRSHVLKFGLSTVSMGRSGATWEQLVHASSETARTGAVPLAVARIEEVGSYPKPAPMIERNGEWIEDPAQIAATARSTRRLHELLAERLAGTPRKEVYLFVHGYNNTFDSCMFRTAQIWHFLGREGVPVAYSWPAGSGGVLRGYTQDRESGEFTNAHLKQFLRDLASCPGLEKVHLIAHSRGTDVLTTALRELHIEFRGTGKTTRDELKIGQVVLAAPDLDLDVFLQRFSADRVGYVPEQLTIYVSPKDKAIGVSGWLFRSDQRIGRLAMGDLAADVAAIAETHPVISIVDVRAKTDRRGHGYFLSSPAVLSDVILVLRDGRRPGAANGRPLIDRESGFWELHDGYPAPPQDTEETADSDENRASVTAAP